MSLPNKDMEIFRVHGEIATLFNVLKSRVFQLGELGVDTARLLVSLSVFAETMISLAQSESERHERKAVVEELLSKLREDKDGREKS